MSNHVEEWKKWKAILRNNLDAEIEYINLAGWPGTFKGKEKLGARFQREVLGQKPKTVGDAVELAANLPDPDRFRPGAIPHLAWLVSWEDADGFPFIRIKLKKRR
jgi:hypothetical protein